MSPLYRRRKSVNPDEKSVFIKNLFVKETILMRNIRKFVALAIALVMCISVFAACGKTPNNPDNGGNDAAEGTPLVVGYSPFSEKFSPFYADTAYDQDVVSMTQASLLLTDRVGEVIYKGIEGETKAYNGTDYTYKGLSDLEVVQNDDRTVDYTFKIRDDVKFSDGEALTVDDIIFTMYVLLDPTYSGSSTLYAAPIKGLEAYRTGITTLSSLLAELGEDNTDFTLVTEEQQTAFWGAVNDGLVKFAQEIVDYCVDNGYNEAGDVVGAAKNWGFALEEGADVKAFALAIGDAYGWNFSAMEAETANSALSDLIPEDVYNYSGVGVKTGESAANVEGIVKVDDTTIKITTDSFDATAIYQLGVQIAPLHYYGETEKYDYENNKFGFDKGDLSHVKSVSTVPMGAGPYKFVKYDNKVVYFEANDNYFLGAPKTKNVQFKESADADKVSGVGTGTIDITDPSFSKDAAAEIATYNSNGTINGDKIDTNLVANLGYGYIGINASNVNVGGVSDSDASKNLRKAIATVLAVYRDMAVDSYYGEAAEVINYPISSTSWAAPQKSDVDYKVAFSTGIDGADLYTADMDADAKYAAALEAALKYFEAAGYTVEDGKLTAAPEGAKLAYEAIIPGDGNGDHPAFSILTAAKEAFASIGFDLIINDPADSNVLWDALDANTSELWCAAWGATIDPDMYQVYHSSNIVGLEGSSESNHYHIQDAELDQYIMDARTSADQAYRKTVYKACLDTIIDWAVEIPVYQRQNCIIFSAGRVNIDTVTKDITTFYGWMSEIQNLEMK